MKVPVKGAVVKNKQMSSSPKKYLAPFKAGNKMVGKQTSKPAKKQ